MTISISELEALPKGWPIASEAIIAEHNAIPVLLEVVKAALAWSAAADREVDARTVDERRSHSLARLDAADLMCAALAKVRP